MTSQNEFRAAAMRALEKAVAWREDGPKLPAIPTATTQELRALFDVGLPADGRDGVEVTEDLEAAGEGGVGNNTPAHFVALVQGSGHPVGAAGPGQVVELVTQLRHEAGPRQVEGCRLALAENGGGNLGFEEAAMGIHILERVKNG